MQLQPHSWKREINWLWNLSYARLMQNCRHNHWTILCLFVCLFFTGQDDRLATRLMVYDATDSEAVTQLWTLEVLEFSFVSSVIFDEIENVSRLFHSAALKANNRPSNQYILAGLTWPVQGSVVSTALPYYEFYQCRAWQATVPAVTTTEQHKSELTAN